MIQIKNVHKSFGDKEVLKGIDINIEKGEIFGLLGPSGAGKLSKGMKCRLQLARAIMQSPDIIFLDEPTSGLDPATSKAMHKLIKDC